MYGKILLVGTVSNVAKTLEKELNSLRRALAIFNSVEVFLVESDSSDNTVEVLKKIAHDYSNFTFISKNQLFEKYPNRIDRIAFCRNIYVNYIREHYENKKWNFIAVADLDGMNFKLRKNKIVTCFKSNLNWDGVMANQKYGYYDIYALRAEGWVEEDCFKELESIKKLADLNDKSKIMNKNLFKRFFYFDKFRKEIIYDRMRKLPVKSNWVKVLSAFGGFAIYKPRIFLVSDYSPLESNQVISEHVNFHIRPETQNFNFYINPSLINSNFNEYNINKFKFIRLIREIKKINHKKSE